MCVKHFLLVRENDPCEMKRFDVEGHSYNFKGSESKVSDLENYLDYGG